MYAFSEDDEDEEFTDGFYFGTTTTQFEPSYSNETQKIAEEMNKSLTQMKTNKNDFETLLFEKDYKINKTWLKHYLSELESIHALTKKKTSQNVSVEDTLASLSIDNKQPTSNKQLEESMMKKLEAKLFEEFNAVTEPYWLHLILIENCRDYSFNKYNSLACTIAKIFEKWTRTNQQETDLKQEIKIAAFIIGSKYNLLLIDLLAKIYKINENDQFILPYLKYRTAPCCNFRDKFDYKDKALLISACMMHDHFDLEEILMPLLLQDKLTVLEKYLSKSPKQQKLFVQLLDKSFANGSSLINFFHKYRELKDVKSDKLSNKYLGKLLTRLIKTYQIDASLCPNITNQRFYKNLKYLVYRRYVEQSINYEPWKDLITECLTQADYLTDAFIDLLTEHNDFNEINKWINILNIDIQSLPTYTQSCLESLLKENASNEPNQIDAKIEANYYKLKLSETNIKLIETRDVLFQSLDEIIHSKHKTKSGHVFVGIDSEWKPSVLSGVEECKRASLIQISTHELVYLLDVSVLVSELSHNDMQLFTKNFIYNKNIIKVGYGFSEDIKKISHSFNAQDHDQFRQTVLDLEYLISQITILNVPFFDDSENRISTEDSDIKEKGLSELVRLCFGKPLNKSALDAYVLIELYEYIKKRLVKLNLKFDIHRCIGKRYKTPSSNTQKADKKAAVVLEEKQLDEIKKFEDESFKLNETPIGVQDLRIVCDNMLGGLGKELRRCGVDTVILENERKHTDVAKIARKENRYALSSGLPYFIIRSQLPEGKCIHVKTETAKLQCTQVLKVLNVSVKLTDLFSRCRACNTGSYTIITKPQAKALWSKCKTDFPDLFIGYEKNKSKLSSRSSQFSMSETQDYDFKNDMDLIEKIDIYTFHLVKYPNVRVLFESIFDTTLEAVDLYYICDGCGHIYWEGPHWQNITSRFSHVLSETSNDLK